MFGRKWKRLAKSQKEEIIEVKGLLGSTIMERDEIWSVLERTEVLVKELGACLEFQRSLGTWVVNRDMAREMSVGTQKWLGDIIKRSQG